MWFMALVEGMLFVGLTKVEDGWLCHNDRIGSMPEVGFGSVDKLVVEKVKDRMGNIVGDEEPIAWCDWLLGVQIAAKAVWKLAPFFLQLKENGAMFGAVVGFTAMVHAV
jgi:hypothetical protein